MSVTESFATAACAYDTIIRLVSVLKTDRATFVYAAAHSGEMFATDVCDGAAELVLLAVTLPLLLEKLLERLVTLIDDEEGVLVEAELTAAPGKHWE